MKIEVNHGKWDGGKGSQPRKTNMNKYEENYDRIFKKPDPSLYKQSSWCDEESLDKNVSTVID